MNKTTEAMKLAEEAQTPLKDLLRAVPKDGSDLYEEDKFCHHNIPYGRLIHEALAEIERLEVLAKPEITTPDVCGEVCARAKLCYGCGKALDEANAKLADHVEQNLTMVAEPAIPEWVDVDDYEEPSVSDGVCGGCAKKSADGWALYCVECWEKAEPVKQEPVATDLMDMLRLIETIKYLRGIAERGLGREIREDETIEQFVLGYVKQLESTQPVKQEPVAYVSDLTPQKRIDFFNDGLGLDTPLYLHLIDAKAIRAEALDALRTHNWTREMSDAWHRAIPNLEKACDDLIAAAIRGLK